MPFRFLPRADIQHGPYEPDRAPVIEDGFAGRRNPAFDAVLDADRAEFDIVGLR
jgi:hypothetical protein